MDKNKIEMYAEGWEKISSAIGEGAGSEDLFSHPMWNEQICIAEDLIRDLDS